MRMSDEFGLKKRLESLEDLSELSDEEFQQIVRSLDKKSKDTLARRGSTVLSTNKQKWYCGDRECDGRPHPGADYPHARGSKREDQRGSQYPPLGTDWITWAMLAGRGSGKSITGSRYTRYVSHKVPHIGLIGPTGPTLRNVMIEGPSGLIKACEAAGEYTSGMYEPSKQRFTFQSGAVATLFSAEEPERIRGSNLAFVWGDEPAFWDDPQAVWDMMMFALRAGVRPHVLATTTPLPSEFIKKLVAMPTTRVVTGSTYDNRANLPTAYFQNILDKYEGTYLGRQEIHGEIIDDREGALWSSEQFSEDNFYFDIEAQTFDRVVVGIDPAGSNNKRSDLTGIVVGGKADKMLYAIDDFSGKFSPSGWARASINAYEKYSADAIVVERNYGGDMCRDTLKAEGFEGRIIEAKATDGKRVRAEPISAKYEQHLARHRRGGRLSKLESEMVSWIPGEGKSPNRVDAWVWVASSLTRGGGRASYGDVLDESVSPDSYRGPGSAYSRKQAKRGRR